MKICFRSFRYQNWNFSLVSHSCRTRFAFESIMSHSCCLCCTRVALMSVVSHSCRSCRALVLWNRLDQWSQFSWTVNVSKRSWKVKRLTDCFNLNSAFKSFLTAAKFRYGVKHQHCFPRVISQLEFSRINVNADCECGNVLRSMEIGLVVLM